MTIGRNKVFVKREKAPETTAGGLTIPDAAREKPDYGEVIAVGADVKDWKVGDKVTFPKWVGFIVVLPNDNSDYLVVFEDEIWLAI
jgi:chaperonin GroES